MGVDFFKSRTEYTEEEGKEGKYPWIVSENPILTSITAFQRGVIGLTDIPAEEAGRQRNVRMRERGGRQRERKVRIERRRGRWERY